MSQPQCPNCGMPQTEWLGSDREGFEKDGRTFCCQGCAQGGAGSCTCRVADPGVTPRDGEGDAAELLMTPRDRNGRPLRPEEIEAAERSGEIVQLDTTAARPPAPPAENPRTATTN
jgi:hypothetical protein